jgi:uncharacterized protein DUF1501
MAALLDLRQLVRQPGDVMATIYRLLGIDHRRELYDPLQRPHRIVPKGEVVEELIG